MLVAFIGTVLRMVVIVMVLAVISVFTWRARVARSEAGHRCWPWNALHSSI